MPDPASLEVELSETVPRTFAAGLDMVTDGGVLSTRTSVTAAEIVELPALSVATTCRSYRPSVSPVVSQDAAVVVQLFDAAGEYWYETEAAPAPPSVVDQLSATMPRTLAPG